MPPNPQEEARVRTVLAQFGLPNTLGVFDFGSLPPDAEGAYVAQQDTFLLNVGACDQTIIHEGAHAEHYAAAGIVGPQFPTIPDTAVGAVILSEAFVGHRLANVNGFMVFEYNRLAKYSKTIVEVAEEFFSTPDAQGPPVIGGGRFVPGRVMSTAILGFLLLHLPIVVAEVAWSKPVVTAGLSATSAHPTVQGTGAFFLRAVQDVLGLLAQAQSPPAVAAALTSVPNMTSVGATFMGSLRAAKVI